MSDFLTNLMHQRRLYLDGANANKEDINLDIFEDFYPDQAHFVFELLQNAEDTGATEASFVLQRNGCWFEHNGKRSFTEADVRAITGVNSSTKKKDLDQIGRFGIGFKSVFAYTRSPTIFSRDFSFRIAEYVLPQPVETDPGIGDRTKFWLPFDHPNRDASEAFSDVAAGLSELSETALLFLPNIESIKWSTEGSSTGEILRIEHTAEHVEVLKQIDGRTTTSSHFLRFSQVVKGLEKQRVAVAFALDAVPGVKALDPKKAIAEQLKVVPANGQVAVFFPAKKETSGLRFHLHAPFVPELSRASIKDTPANKPLFEQLAELCVASLFRIRDLGLLTPEFLGVLPNPSDALGSPHDDEDSPYDAIREAIVEAMNHEPLTPTNDKSHAPANTLYQAKAWVKDLLTKDDIEYLIEYDDEPPLWAANQALQGTPVERFMTGLAITDWDADALLQCIEDKATDDSWNNPDDEFIAWISKKPIEWHQQFYAQLVRDPDTTDDLYRLRDCAIVRLSDGSYTTGPGCYFPDENGHAAVGVQCVDAAVYTSGKSSAQQTGARKFLEEIGVTTIGERQMVEALLRSSYTHAERPLREREYLRDIRRFMKLSEDDQTAYALLSSFPVFMGVDNKWHKPAELFLDIPLHKTGLSDFFKLSGKPTKLVALAPLYQNLPIDTPKLVRFAERLGCVSKLSVTRTNCRQNPQWSYLANAPGERYTSPIDRDYLIEGLPKVEGHQSVALSRLIWDTMCQLPGTQQNWDYPRSQNPLRATYQKSDSRGAHYADSQLVHQLRTLAWVPQEGGAFVRPAQARAELLPDGFTFDPGSSWIKAVQFGKNIAIETERAKAQAAAVVEKQRKDQEAAKALGFSDAETARHLAEIPDDELRSMLAERERRRSIILPEHEPANPNRRSERVLSHAITSPQRRTEERTRSVSVGRDEVKVEASQYLTQQYTNADAQQICQICKDELPFKLDDGSHFFEAVELIEGLSKWHAQNYLCLCPNHSAMFRHANSSKGALRAMVVESRGNEIDVVVAQTPHSIYFTRTHLTDLKAILEAEDSGVPAAVNGTTS